MAAQSKPGFRQLMDIQVELALELAWLYESLFDHGGKQRFGRGLRLYQR
jgi:hypothetical protein